MLVLVHPPHRILDTISRMSDYHPWVNSGRLGAGPSSLARPFALTDQKSGGDTSHNNRAIYASDPTYTTDVSAPARELLQGEEQYDDDDDDEEEGEDAEYVIVDEDLSMVSQFGVHDQPLLTAGLQEPSPKVIIDLKRFAGGFVSGLRRLQRLLRNQLDQILRRQPSQDMVLELPAPGYDPSGVHAPSILLPAAIPQPTFAPHHPQNTPHASIFTKSTVTPGTTPFLSTITPSTTYSSLRRRRRDHSRLHPAVKGTQPLNSYKPSKSVTSGPAPPRSGVKRSNSTTRSHLLSPLSTVLDLEPSSSTSLRPAMKSDDTWSTIAGTFICIFSSRKSDLSVPQVLRITHDPTLRPTNHPAFKCILSLPIQSGTK
jgi:hypothetical protein